MAKINISGTIPITEPYKQGENYFLHDASLSGTPVLYKNVLAQAQKSICILDPYAFEHDATRVFESIHEENIKIYIITTKYEEDDIKSFADDIINIIKKNINTYYLNIISYKERGVKADQRIPLWHDRYLIIDDTDYYLIGSSLDAQQTSNKYHGIFQLTEKADKDVVANLFKVYISNFNGFRAYKTSRQ